MVWVKFGGHTTGPRDDEGEVWKENGRLEEHYHEDFLEKPLDLYFK
jgi:hypothetical protein